MERRGEHGSCPRSSALEEAACYRDALFQSVLKKAGRKKALWERMRALFHCFKLESMEILYSALLHGFMRCEPIIGSDTS